MQSYEDDVVRHYQHSRCRSYVNRCCYVQGGYHVKALLNGHRAVLHCGLHNERLAHGCRHDSHLGGYHGYHGHRALRHHVKMVFCQMLQHHRSYGLVRLR